MLRPTCRSAPPRGGFTLLEILLAALIAALLLAALYAAMHTTLQQTQVTRDAVEVEDLSRGVFNKMTIDLGGTLAPLPPKSGGNSAASGGTTAAPSTAPAGMTPTDGSVAPAAGTTPTIPTTDPNAAAADPNAAAMPGATDNATAVSADYAFQGGLIGEDKKMVIYATKVPEVFSRYGNAGEQVRPDQRQIIYWFEPGRGLYRRERPWVTADGVRNSIEADPEAPDAVLLADEVTDDGTTPGPDGVTPLGPPRAVKVTLTLQFATGRGEPLTKTAVQIIPIRAAPGTYTPPLLEAPTDGATGGSTEATAGTTPSTPSGGSTTPSSPSGGMTPSSPSGGKTPSSPSGGMSPSSPSGGGKTSSPGGMTPSSPSGGGNTPSAPSGGGKGGNTQSGGKGGGR
jgi:prepilin-type N-terminal cleavage/methylation domain-containing protein